MRYLEYLKRLCSLSERRKSQPRRTLRPRLGLEQFEDRLVPSAASQLGSTLNIIADPGTSTAATKVLLQADSANPSLVLCHG